MGVVWIVLIPIIVVVLVLFFGKPLPVKNADESSGDKER